MYFLSLPSANIAITTANMSNDGDTASNTLSPGFKPASLNK